MAHGTVGCVAPWLQQLLALPFAYTITDAAAAATVFGVPVALLVYVGNSRASRLSHMHKLFSDYLRMAFEFSSRRRPRAAEVAELASFRMYSMEEMYLWILQERRFIVGPFRWIRRGWQPTRYDRALQCWEDTIVSHVADRHRPESARETARNLMRNKECYTDEYRDFLLRQKVIRDFLPEGWPDEQASDPQATAVSSRPS